MLRAHGVVVGTLIVLTCGDPATPRPEPYLRLFLSSRSAGPGQVLVLEATVTTPSAPVYYASGCGEEDGIAFEILDPRGQRVAVTAPGSDPACLSQTAQLPHGDLLVSCLRFDGTVYDAEGARFEALPGNYIVFVRFRYGPERADTEDIVLEQRTSFRWLDRTAVP